MSAAEIGNWSRWGDDDERGAANLVTPEVVRHAASLVRSGAVIPLGLVLRGSNFPTSPPRHPPQHFMTVDGGAYLAGARAAGGAESADSHLSIGTHVGTHIDALSHIWDGESMYNGFSRSEVRSTSGARRNGIEKLGAISTRGVLIDIPRFLGVDRLEPSQRIGASLLADCLAAQGVSLASGDAVLIRTGWMSMFGEDEYVFHTAQPGLDLDGARYLSGHDVVLVGSDNPAVEVIPWDDSGDRSVAAVHLHLIRDHGIYLVEMLHLDALSQHGATEFLFVLAPLLIKGGVGSPVNPIAIC